MTYQFSRISSAWRRAAVALLVFCAACGGSGKKNVVPANVQPDRYLMDRANDAMMKKQWVRAREYYRQVVDNYPQSPLRPDAKLGIGDSYLNEGGTENYILGANEFREFLTFYPTHMRADYAQYKLAMTHYKRMRRPERDQTETAAAVREFEVFFERYPNSMLTSEVRQRWREARSRLSEASYKVGLYYYRARWYPGAIDRFKEVLKDDPGYPERDAVYYYLAESLLKTDKKAEALPYYDRLVKEFERSEFLADAHRKLETLSIQ